MTIQQLGRTLKTNIAIRQVDVTSLNEVESQTPPRWSTYNLCLIVRRQDPCILDTYSAVFSSDNLKAHLAHQMPGRKTAKKCSTCRQRKIKCGLQDPACLQCVKGGWLCPGYEVESRFHAYKSSTKSSDDEATSRSSGSTATPTESVVERHTTTTRWIFVFPPSKEESLRNELVFKITFNAVAARLMVISNADILQQIPARIGQSRALDDAVACICKPPTLASQSPSEFPSRLYANALTSLQRALQEDEKSAATETIAAAT